MEISALINSYYDFEETEVKNRFLKHHRLLKIIERLPRGSFNVEQVGVSEEGRTLNLITWGNGPAKIFLWSQMHGDEATGTMALLDLFNFLQHQQYENFTRLIKQNCTLYLLPMVNPDGAERFTRRNAKQIDINRDFLQTSSAEAKVLKLLRDKLQPHFGFNLHDQDTLWSVAGTLKPATLSYLAPSYNASLAINDNRLAAMLVIADIYKFLAPLLPGQIGLFKDEYEPRAFGDNFQLAGTSTILIEAGGFQQDYEKQTIRKYYFLSVISGIWSIATASYKDRTVASYFDIPKNEKQIFHILLNNVIVDGVKTSVGLNYEITYQQEMERSVHKYFVKDIGDLSYCMGYQTYNCDEMNFEGNIVFEQQANLKLTVDNKIILAISNGLLT
ncbi:M14 family zinc carboxypeptidase [Pedobacter sp. PWIIR3]